MKGFDAVEQTKNTHTHTEAQSETARMGFSMWRTRARYFALIKSICIHQSAALTNSTVDRDDGVSSLTRNIFDALSFARSLSSSGLTSLILSHFQSLSHQNFE